MPDITLYTVEIDGKTYTTTQYVDENNITSAKDIWGKSLNPYKTELPANYNFYLSPQQNFLNQEIKAPKLITFKEFKTNQYLQSLSDYELVAAVRKEKYYKKKPLLLDPRQAQYELSRRNTERFKQGLQEAIAGVGGARFTQINNQSIVNQHYQNLPRNLTNKTLTPDLKPITTRQSGEGYYPPKIRSKPFEPKFIAPKAETTVQGRKDFTVNLAIRAKTSPTSITQTRAKLNSTPIKTVNRVEPSKPVTNKPKPTPIEDKGQFNLNPLAKFKTWRTRANSEARKTEVQQRRKTQNNALNRLLRATGRRNNEGGYVVLPERGAIGDAIKGLGRNLIKPFQRATKPNKDNNIGRLRNNIVERKTITLPFLSRDRNIPTTVPITYSVRNPKTQNIDTKIVTKQIDQQNNIPVTFPKSGTARKYIITFRYRHSINVLGIWIPVMSGSYQIYTETTKEEVQIIPKVNQESYWQRGVGNRSGAFAYGIIQPLQGNAPNYWKEYPMIKGVTGLRQGGYVHIGKEPRHINPWWVTRRFIVNFVGIKVITVPDDDTLPEQTNYPDIADIKPNQNLTNKIKQPKKLKKPAPVQKPNNLLPATVPKETPDKSPITEPEPKPKEKPKDDPKPIITPDRVPTPYLPFSPQVPINPYSPILPSKTPIITPYRIPLRKPNRITPKPSNFPKFNPMPNPIVIINPSPVNSPTTTITPTINLNKSPIPSNINIVKPTVGSKVNLDKQLQPVPEIKPVTQVRQTPKPTNCQQLKECLGSNGSSGNSNTNNDCRDIKAKLDRIEKLIEVLQAVHSGNLSKTIFLLVSLLGLLFSLIAVTGVKIVGNFSSQIIALYKTFIPLVAKGDQIDSDQTYNNTANINSMFNVFVGMQNLDTAKGQATNKNYKRSDTLRM